MNMPLCHVLLENFVYNSSFFNFNFRRFSLGFKLETFIIVILLHFHSLFIHLCPLFFISENVHLYKCINYLYVSFLKMEILINIEKVPKYINKNKITIIKISSFKTCTVIERSSQPTGFEFQ